jgi:uncharacterized protein
VRRMAANYMEAVVHSALAPFNQSAASNRRIKQEIDEESRSLLDEISWEKIKPRYAAIYRKGFTDDELKAVIAYYTSPVGRKFIAAQEDLNAQKTRIAQEIVRELQPKLKAVVDRVIAANQSELQNNGSNQVPAAQKR